MACSLLYVRGAGRPTHVYIVEIVPERIVECVRDHEDEVEKQRDQEHGDRREDVEASVAAVALEEENVVLAHVTQLRSMR